MAKGRNDFGAHQQIIFLNGKLQEAIQEAKKTGEPFEYRHYGLLYSKTRRHYEGMGFELTWHRDAKIAEKSYWSFTVPDLKINLSNLR